MVWSNRIYVITRTKKDRSTILRWLLDEIAKKEIDVFLFHFGLFLIYNEGNNMINREDIEQIGIRRSKLFSSLPRFILMSNDNFLTYMWEELITYLPSDQRADYRCNPKLKEVRMLFKPKRYSQYTGVYISDADWIEPISGPRDHDYHKWLGENDPLIPEDNKPDMIEGLIILGNIGKGNIRHFVGDKPLYAGCYIEVRFGEGWISGRYEYLSKEPQIRIVSTRGDVIFIEEHHLVRMYH